MGETGLLSLNDVKRILSYTDNIYCQEYKILLSDLGAHNEKEKTPKYKLANIEFNLISRVTRIDFQRIQEYRTIVKYKTINYIKYPIYSEWKIKPKIIKKTIRLTNSVLEQLHNNEDELIKLFAEEIVININHEELYPSWFVRMYLSRELDFDLCEMEKTLGYNNEKENKKIDEKRSGVKNNETEINVLLRRIAILEKKKKRKEKSLNKLLNSKPNFFKYAFSLGIYSYYISTKRKNKLENKIKKRETEILSYRESINSIEEANLKLQSEIKQCLENIEQNNKNFKTNKDDRLKQYSKTMKEVKPLSSGIDCDKQFSMLKEFNGFDYKKIIGVYVIHNREKNKYYVGQSKDIMKRIRQHFNGTVPKNQIFAEDYYTSAFPNKEDLFELKIIGCETKDELDRLEKELIYEYDSWQNGYNGTSGNI